MRGKLGLTNHKIKIKIKIREINENDCFPFNDAHTLSVKRHELWKSKKIKWVFFWIMNLHVIMKEHYEML